MLFCVIVSHFHVIFRKNGQKKEIRALLKLLSQKEAKLIMSTTLLKTPFFRQEIPKRPKKFIQKNLFLIVFR